MSKKTNPRKIPKSQADVDKARKHGQSQGIELAMTIFFTAVLDKGFLPPEDIPKLWDAVLYVSKSIIDGYVDIYENKKMLEEEYGVTFSKLEV